MFFRHGTKGSRLAIFSGMAAVMIVGLAVTRIHLRVQTTLIGYEIGGLKHEEARLLEERGSLKMQFAKLTTKKHLMLMTESDGDTKIAKGTLALK